VRTHLRTNPNRLFHIIILLKVIFESNLAITGSLEGFISVADHKRRSVMFIVPSNPSVERSQPLPDPSLFAGTRATCF
jgi:hypothetical protein